MKVCKCVCTRAWRGGRPWRDGSTGATGTASSSAPITVRWTCHSERALQTLSSPMYDTQNREDPRISLPDPAGRPSNFRQPGALPAVSPHLTGLLPPCSPEVLLLLGSPRLSLSPLAHFWAHIPRSVFSAKAASVPYCWQCASIARSKMWGFSCLAASQGLRAGTVPCHSGPALKTLTGTDTRWRRLAWPHKALGRSSPFPGEWTPISIILVGSTLQGCVMVHIFPCLAEHHFTM